MAYDPNDAADVAIVTAAVNDALEAQREAHEAEITGLKANRDRLKKDLAKARSGDTSGGEDQGAEIERLETELRETRTKLSKAERDLRTVSQERDTFRTTSETETTLNRNMVVERGLTDALIEANVAADLMPGARALLEKQVKVEGEGVDRRAVGADGKPLGEFVKTWALGAQGKHYVAAPNNTGGGAGGNNGNPQGGTKKLEDMSEAERTTMARENPEGFKAIRRAAGQQVDF